MSTINEFPPLLLPKWNKYTVPISVYSTVKRLSNACKMNHNLFDSRKKTPVPYRRQIWENNCAVIGKLSKYLEAKTLRVLRWL